MTFDRPGLLLLGPLVAFLLTLLVVAHRRKLSLLGQAYGDAASLRLVPRSLQGLPTLRTLCLIAASCALSVAAAGPRPAPEDAPEPAAPLQLAVAVDVSRSMGASDVAPTRIQRASEVVDRLSEGLPSARIVLVLFADWPYTLVPPTDDPDVVRYFASALSADLVLERDQGTSFSTALELASRQLDARPMAGARRAVLMISDGEAHEPLSDVLAATARATGEGTTVWTAGVGTTDGGSVTTAAGPVMEARGRAARTRLQEPVLHAIAEAGGGDYIDVTTPDGLATLLAALGGSRDEASTPEPPLDLDFWLVLLAIPLLLVDGWLDGAGGRRTRA